MPGLFAEIPLIFAQNAQPAAPGNSFWGGMSSYVLFIPVLFYFVVLRPQQLQEKKRKDLLGALKKNDRVLTTAGMYGTVVSVHPESDRVVVRIDDERGVKVEFTKASIARVIDPAAEKGAEAPEKAPAR